MTTHAVGPPTCRTAAAGEATAGIPKRHQFVQPGTVYRDVLSNTHRDHLVANIVGYAGKDVVTTDTKARVGEYWRQVSPDLGARVAKGLGNGG